MSAKQLVTDFQNQLQQAPRREGDQSIVAASGQERIECQLSHLDQLACRVTRLSVHSDALQQHSAAQLDALAQRLASRLTYLLEPIRTVEADADERSVQLRSNPPQRDELGSHYYELFVRGSGEIELKRYLGRRGAARQEVPADFTLQVLLRLVGDLAAAGDERL